MGGEGGICNFTPLNGNLPSCTRGAELGFPLLPTRHWLGLRFACWVFWGARGLQLLAQEHGEHLLSPLRIRFQSLGNQHGSCCRCALEQQLPLSLIPTLGWGKKTKISAARSKRWRAEGHIPGLTGPCKHRWAPASTVHTAVPCGSASVSSIRLNLGEML